MNKSAMPLIAALALTVIALLTTSCANTGLGSGSATPKETAQTGPANKSFNTPQTFVNTQHNFKYTIPAGWFVVTGDPTANDVNFMKSDNSMGFLISISQMPKHFANEAAVRSGLRQSLQEVESKRLFEAVSRNDGNEKCGVTGWEITEAPRQSSFQRIVWQAYNGENWYFNFNANADKENFEKARPELRKIMDAIEFCNR